MRIKIFHHENVPRQTELIHIQNLQTAQLDPAVWDLICI